MIVMATKRITTGIDIKILELFDTHIAANMAIGIDERFGLSLQQIGRHIWGERWWYFTERDLTAAALQRLRRRGLIWHAQKSMTAAGSPALWMRTEKRWSK